MLKQAPNYEGNEVRWTEKPNIKMYIYFLITLSLKAQVGPQYSWLHCDIQTCRLMVCKLLAKCAGNTTGTAKVFTLTCYGDLFKHEKTMVTLYNDSCIITDFSYSQLQIQYSEFQSHPHLSAGTEKQIKL